MHRNELEARINERADKDAAYKEELLTDAKAVLERELGSKLPESLRVKVVVETSDTAYLVLRVRPPKGRELDDSELQAATGGRTNVATTTHGPVGGANQFGGAYHLVAIPGQTTRGQ